MAISLFIPLLAQAKIYNLDDIPQPGRRLIEVVDHKKIPLFLWLVQTDPTEYKLFLFMADPLILFPDSFLFINKRIDVTTEIDGRNVTRKIQGSDFDTTLISCLFIKYHLIHSDWQIKEAYLTEDNFSPVKLMNPGPIITSIRLLSNYPKKFSPAFNIDDEKNFSHSFDLSYFRDDVFPRGFKSSVALSLMGVYSRMYAKTFHGLKHGIPTTGFASLPYDQTDIKIVILRFIKVFRNHRIVDNRFFGRVEILLDQGVMRAKMTKQIPDTYYKGIVDVLSKYFNMRIISPDPRRDINSFPVVMKGSDLTFIGLPDDKISSLVTLASSIFAEKINTKLNYFIKHF